MKKLLLLLTLAAAGATLIPHESQAGPRSRVVWEVVDDRPVRRVVYFEGDRPYYTVRGERRWVRSYYHNRPRSNWRDGRRVYAAPSIQLNF